MKKRNRMGSGHRVGAWKLKLAIALVVLVAIVWTRVGAQEESPEQGPSQQTTIQGISAGGAEGAVFLEAMDRVFDTSSDSVNFEEGTFNWKGRSFSFGDSRAMRSRFVQYLNSPVNTMDNRVYLALLEEISHRLSILEHQENFDRSDPWRNVVSAWKLLFQAGDHLIDGGASLVVANMVHENWRDRREFYNQAFWRDVEQAEMEVSRGRAVAETDRQFQRDVDRGRQTARLRQEGVDLRIQREMQGRETDESGDGEEDRPAAPRSPDDYAGLDFRSMEGLTDLDLAMERLMRSQATLEGRELRMREIGLMSRLKMQSQIVAFLTQRRFHHTKILSSFYRMLFTGTSQELEVGKSQLAGLLPDADFVPTVNMLESVALQAINDVRVTMESVNNAYDQGQRISALERLQEAFFLGEYSFPVITFEEERKRVLRDLYFLLRDARKLADLRDYAALEELIGEITELADDFPETEIAATIRRAKQASNMKLMGARSAMLRNDISGAESMINEAFEIWPLNPEIGTFMSDSVSGADYVREFDVDYRNGDFRRIFNRRAEYMTALTGDEERMEQLGEVLETIQNIEFAVSTAEAQLNQGNHYAAWEILHGIRALGEDDPEYLRAVARVAPRVSNWVSILERAREHEERGRWAAALNDYLRARELYPPSSVVNESLERVGERLLDEVSAEMEPPG